MTALLRGRLIERGHEAYEHSRVERLFQARRPQRQPAAILLAETEQDVVEGVRLARARGWTVSVRSGGHSFPAWSVRDDGLLIDLGGFKEMTYDASTTIATATPSITGGDDLNPYLARHGRFFGGGLCSSVGLGGFLLQGGLGFNYRGWGYAAAQVVAIDVVTADGDLVRADRDQNSDLFWAARGAGPGFFGVVTRFHLLTRTASAGLAATTHIYPIEKHAEVLSWLFEVNRHISPDVHLLALSMQSPIPLDRAKNEFVFVISAIAFCDALDASATALRPFNESPCLDKALVVLDSVPTTLAEQYEFAGGAHPKNMRYRVDSAWVEGPATDIIAAARPIVEERPTFEGGYTFFQFGLRHQPADMAMSLETEVMIGAYLVYGDERDDDLYDNWSRNAMQRLEPFTVGQYWGDSDQQHRSVRCLTDEAWTRLTAVRAARDPSGLFAGYLTAGSAFDNVNDWTINPTNEHNQHRGATVTTWWQDFYGDIDNQRLDSLKKRLADDVVVNMAGNPPVTGVSAVIEGQREFFTMFRSLRHDFVKTWELDDDAILEALVTYVRHDGDAVEVPCTTILHRTNDLVDSVRVYLDLTPLFAVSETAAGSA